MVSNDPPKITQTQTLSFASTDALVENGDQCPSMDSKNTVHVLPSSMLISLEESEAPKDHNGNSTSSAALTKNESPFAKDETLSACEKRRRGSSSFRSPHSLNNTPSHPPGGNSCNYNKTSTPPSPEEAVNTSSQSTVKRRDAFAEPSGYGSNDNPVEESTIPVVEEYWTRTLRDLPPSNGNGLQHFSISMLKVLIEKIRSTPPLQLLWTFVLMVSLLGGNILQVIGLNFWLTKFPADGAPGNYAIFTVSSLIFALFFIISLGFYVLINSPDLSFVWQSHGLKLLVLTGVYDAVSSTLSIYSASHTPEILQTLFTAFIPLYTMILAKWFLNDTREYLNWWTITSFSLIITGVLIASISHLWPTAAKEEKNVAAKRSERDSESDQVIWSVLFFLSVLPTVFLNITQTLYMKHYTYNEEDELARFQGRFEVFGGLFHELEEDKRISEEAGPLSSPGVEDISTIHPTLLSAADFSSISTDTSNTNPVHINISHNNNLPSPPRRGEDAAVKLVMLTVDTTVQFLFALAFMPLDALPWFGGSSSVPQTWSNFLDGLRSLVSCPGNFEFCAVYSTGFVLTYLSASYLNQRSVTLCSMVSQLTSPTTAVTLLIFPSLNLGGDVGPWYWSVLAVMLLSIGVLVYVVWDAQTNPERVPCGGDPGLEVPLLSHTTGSSRNSSSIDNGNPRQEERS